MPANKGFIASPITNINQIKALLQDRYSEGFPIIKELVQNGDDAGAHRLDMGWVPYLPGAVHPLLKGPGLFFVNDGSFRAKDAKAIRRIGDSSKVDEPTIGKFGLGLKSIFHLCEAYFFLASHDPETDSANPWGDILNPWSGDDDLGIHEEWDDFSIPCQQAMIQRLAAVLDTPRWFCLWLPLRQRAHCESSDAIVQEFPGDHPTPPKSIFLPDLKFEVAGLLPLLHNVAQIRIWSSDQGQQDLGKPYGLQISEQAQRIQYDGNTRKDSRSLKGRVAYQIEGRVTTLMHFGGQEAYFRHAGLDSLRQSPFWPKTPTLDEKTKRITHVPDKVAPHGAVCFYCREVTGQAFLNIYHAVFLPIEENSQALACEGKHDFTLILHGLYFVDPGRRSIHADQEIARSAPGQEQEVRQQWNVLLLREGVLRLLLPALDRFVKEQALSRTAVEHLTVALAKSELYQKYQLDICAKRQWGFCLDGESGQWQLLSADDPMHALPDPPQSDQSRPYTVFPHLRTLCTRKAITLAGKPRLAKTAPWQEDEVLRLMQIQVQQVFAEAKLLEYFAQFLEAQTRSWLDSYTNLLSSLVRQAIGEIPWDQLRGHQALVRRVTALLPAQQRLRFRADNTPTWDRILADLCQEVPAILILPELLDAEEPSGGTARLSPQQAAPLLRMLANAPAAWQGLARFDEARTRIALRLFASVEDKGVLFGLCGDLMLFWGRDLSQAREVLFTVTQLQELFEKKTLFTLGTGSDRSVGDALQKALPSECVVLINQETAEVLFGTNEVRPCTPRDCIEVLTQRPALGAPEQREGLVALLLHEQDRFSPEVFRKAIRYLLHGQPSFFSDELPLLVQRLADTDELWGKVAREVLRLRAELWRLLPRNLVAKIAEQHWENLQLHALNEAGVTKLLEQVDLAHLDCEVFSPQEQTTLLRRIESAAIFRDLRLHKDISGNTVSLVSDRPVYLQGDIQLDPILVESLCVIRRHPDRQVAEKQERWVKALDAPAILDHVFSHGQPENLWEPILGVFNQVGPTGLSEILVEKMKRTRWLPTKGGTSVRPEDVIHLPRLGGVVSDIMAGLEETIFQDSTALDDRVLEHPAFASFLSKALFPRPQEAVDMIGQCVENNERYYIGEIDESALDDGKFLDEFQQIFEAGNSEMQAYGLIKGLCSHYSAAMCISRLVKPFLRGPLGAPRLIQVLIYLYREHQAVPSQKKPATLEMFNRYLRQACANEAFPRILAEIHLLNKGGEWKQTSALCLDAHSVVDGVLVDDEQREIISGRAQKEGIQAIQPMVESNLDSSHGPVAYGETAQILAQYFKPWEGRVPPELLGAFLCLLGDDIAIKKLAQYYLDDGNWTVEATRDKMDWGVASNRGAFDEPKEETMRRQRFVVSCIDTEDVEVMNLLGDMIYVPIDKRVKHIFVGEDECRFERSDLRTGYVKLRVIDVEAENPSRLVEWLRNSAAILLERIYGRRVDNLEDIWEELSQSDQQHVQIAKSLILESGFFYLRQLGVHHHAKIREVLSDFDKARNLKAEEEQLRVQGRRQTFQSAEKDMRLAREELERLVEYDPEVQAQILHAVRERIGDHYQYRPESIPFEIFQNADDALVELYEMMGEGTPKSPEQFVVSYREGCIAFMHWGRGINRFRLGTFDGRGRGYNRDLEKMLVLSSSDKDDKREDHSVTGKFGLGFKSVFLVSDQPCVLSDKLGFEVVAGMLPVNIEKKQKSSLRKQLEKERDDPRCGTIIELALRADAPPPEQILENFFQLARVLVVFARRIKFCMVRQLTGSPRLFSWQQEAIPGTQKLYTGRFQDAEEDGDEIRSGLVVSTDAGTFLFAVSHHGVVPWSSSVPTVWVMAPTQERDNLGFVFEGAFDLDVGRAQLAGNSEKNLGLARQMGRQMGQALASLLEISGTDWPSLRIRLGLGPDCDVYSFWESVWAVVSKEVPKCRTGASQGAALAYQMLWANEDAGMRHLITRQGALPSGLWGPYRVLTSLEQVVHCTEGWLDSENTFSIVSQWPVFRERVQSGSIISHRAVGNVLRSIGAPESPESLKLMDVLGWGVGEEKQVTPELAQQWARVINAGNMKAMQEKSAAEYGSLAEWLRTLQFEGRDGVFQPARRLLIASDSDEGSDEALRAAFAPPTRVLADTYAAERIEVFRFCREAMSAPVVDMKDWAINATTDAEKGAVLKYLLKGAFRFELAEVIRLEAAKSWLAGLRSLDLFLDLTVEQQDELLWALRFHKVGEVKDEVDDGSLWRRLEPADALGRIADWWDEHSSHYLTEYTKAVYPLGKAPNISDSFSPSRPEDREAWVTFLFLGSLQTIGRANPEQHRSFLETLKRNGTLTTFWEQGTSGEDWIRVLERYLDKETEDLLFYRWVDRFPSMVQLAKWLNEYPECFLAINTVDQAFDLVHITRPRNSSLFQGGGPDAPSLTRTLGIGANFILRELVRLGVIHNKLAYRHCYMPSRTVRTFLSSLGCEGLEDFPNERWRRSTVIHEFFNQHLPSERVTFLRCFDIPFWYISRNIDLQTQILERVVSFGDHDAEDEENVWQ